MQWISVFVNFFCWEHIYDPCPGYVLSAICIHLFEDQNITNKKEVWKLYCRTSIQLNLKLIDLKNVWIGIFKCYSQLSMSRKHKIQNLHIAKGSEVRKKTTSTFHKIIFYLNFIFQIDQFKWWSFKIRWHCKNWIVDWGRADVKRDQFLQIHKIPLNPPQYPSAFPLDRQISAHSCGVSGHAAPIAGETALMVNTKAINSINALKFIFIFVISLI